MNYASVDGSYKADIWLWAVPKGICGEAQPRGIVEDSVKFGWGRAEDQGKSARDWQQREGEAMRAILSEREEKRYLSSLYVYRYIWKSKLCLVSMTFTTLPQSGNLHLLHPLTIHHQKDKPPFCALSTQLENGAVWFRNTCFWNIIEIGRASCRERVCLAV